MKRVLFALALVVGVLAVTPAAQVVTRLRLLPAPAAGGGGAACVGCVYETSFVGCADWDQTHGLGDANVCATTDGIKGAGAWATAGHPNGAEIKAVANYPGGAGGKGVINWYGNGTNNVTGGIAIEPSVGPFAEFYLRWYQKYDPTFTFSGSPAYHKMIYIWGNTSQLIPTIIGNQFGMNYPGTSSLMGAPGWNTVGNGQWHCYEVHGKGGSGNAISQAWIDGVQTFSTTTSTFGNGDAWGYFHVGENASVVSGGDYYVYYDDFAFKTSGRVGCL